MPSVPNRRRAAALALCLAALAPAASAQAADQPDYDIKRSSFKVTVDGVQNTTWQTEHVGSGGCDGSASGSGTEKVRFTSRATRVNAMTMKGLSSPVLSKPKAYVDAIVKLRGKVVRQGNLVAEPGGECGGAGGGSIPRDCGTKSFRGVKFPLAYRLAAKPKDQLEFRPGFVDDVFKNCPSGGYSFPTLLVTNEGEHVRSDLPRDELFDDKLGKIIVIVRGKESETKGEHTFVTTSRWVVTFERIGKTKRG
jgi:hypothetical protein